MAVIRSFKDLQDELLALLDEAGDTSTTLTLVKNALNAAHVKRLTEEAWSFMLYDAQTFPTVVGKKKYSLHSEFFRPLYFRNRTTTDFMSQYMEANLVARGGDWNSDTGPASDFALFGRSGVYAQPTSASVLAVSSSNALDNAHSVTVRGDTAQGVRSETITCGSSGVVAFTNVLRVTKTGVWVGTLTITSNAAAVTVLNLFADESARSYQQIELLVAPDVAETIEYRFYRQPLSLDADDDVTDIPPPFEMVAVYDAFLTLAAYNQYDPQTIVLIQQKRDDLVMTMRQSLGEQANALEAATNYTSYVER